ncbi:nucleoside diphosphate kinase B-like [Rhineura floridana]|uniref:nucleoside diphosphate kinase B-like n=1 Tax=Rhineura floridana TaxID=261503 RepID=UPI002AC81DD5|nr:nucleoside diphosphate kinase B-like [Rhineura floridana]
MQTVQIKRICKKHQIRFKPECDQALCLKLSGKLFACSWLATNTKTGGTEKDHLVWEGLNVVKTGRVMLGETNPADSKLGTIRGDFCVQVGRNIIHGSNSVVNAETEINLWFMPEELIDYTSCKHPWIYD